MLSAAPGWPSKAVAGTWWGDTEEKNLVSLFMRAFHHWPGAATHCRQKQFAADREDD